MKWKEDQNKENEISEGENEARGGTESNEIRDINVSLRTNIGSLSENTTNTKSIKKMSKAACDKKGFFMDNYQQKNSQGRKRGKYKN